MMKPLWLKTSLALLLLLGFAVVYSYSWPVFSQRMGFGTNPSNSQNLSQTTDECGGPGKIPLSQICWDGSQIQVVPSDCPNFASCPSVPPVEEWAEYKNRQEGFSVKYPGEGYDNKYYDTTLSTEESGVKNATFLGGCAVVTFIPSSVRSALTASKDSRYFAFTEPVTKLKVGETARIPITYDDTLVEFIYDRLPDVQIEGKAWKVYQVGNTYEMHSSTKIYTLAQANTDYLLLASSGGTCPEGDTASKIVETLAFQKPASTSPTASKLTTANGVSKYKSTTGYTVAFPDNYQPMKSGNAGEEQKIDDSCTISFFYGGTLRSTVIPYAGEDLKDFYYASDPYLESYDIVFEEKMIGGRKSLVVEKGPAGDSGSGTTLLIPDGDLLLEVVIDFVAKDSETAQIVVNGTRVNSLDISKCQE